MIHSAFLKISRTQLGFQYSEHFIKSIKIIDSKENINSSTNKSIKSLMNQRIDKISLDSSIIKHIEKCQKTNFG